VVLQEPLAKGIFSFKIEVRPQFYCSHLIDIQKIFFFGGVIAAQSPGTKSLGEKIILESRLLAYLQEAHKKTIIQNRNIFEAA
jgi:hypothetical protein